MWSKNSLLFVFVKPKCTVSIIHMHYKCHFLAWSLMLLSLPVFWLCSKFCADKIATSYVFEGATWTYPLFRSVARATTTFQTCQLWTSAKVPRPAVKFPSDAQRNAWTLRFFFQHCESLPFSAMCFLKIYQIRPLMKLTKYVCDFFSFCFSYQMTTNSRHIKTGNLPTCSQES